MTGAQPTIVLCGGDLEDVEGSRLPADALVIAADSGLRHAQPLGLKVDHVVGDMDSVDPTLLEAAAASGALVSRMPAHKDSTDFAAALELIPDDGSAVFAVGVFGGRIEHTLGNLAALAGFRRPVTALTHSGRTMMVRDALTLEGMPGEMVSLIPFGGNATGVSTTGLLFPLRNQTLFVDVALGIDNELTGHSASVTVGAGTLLVVQSGVAGQLQPRDAAQ